VCAQLTITIEGRDNDSLEHHPGLTFPGLGDVASLFSDPQATTTTFVGSVPEGSPIELVAAESRRFLLRSVECDAAEHWTREETQPPEPVECRGDPADNDQVIRRIRMLRTAPSGSADGTCPVVAVCRVTYERATCDTDCNGSPCLCPCAEECREHLWRFSFWVTQYDVSKTFGFGEHQGPAVIGYHYQYDLRFSWNHPGAPLPPWRHPVTGALWQQGDGTVDALQFRLRTTNPAGERQASTWSVPVSQRNDAVEFLACGDPERVVWRLLYNHGRTIGAIVPTDSWFQRRQLLPIYLLDSFTIQGRGANVAEDAQAAIDCLKLIQDGYCDNVCGNCSYVLPAYVGRTLDIDEPGGQVPNERISTWGDATLSGCSSIESGWNWQYVGPQCGQSPMSEPFPRHHWTVEEQGTTMWYVGGNEWQSWHSVAGPDGEYWPDPYTHCYAPTLSYAQQAIQLPVESAITGLYGHNSNSDAEAEYRHFRGCAKDPRLAATPEWYNANVAGRPCEACGVPRSASDGKPIQHPCMDRTRTAQATWSYTSGWHNIADWTPGRVCGDDPTSLCDWADLPRPLCRGDASRLVYGM